jgi:Holliday junction resolvasome RuvABC endonuclease subunit
MTTRDMLDAMRRPCYLGCDVQTTGMGVAAVVVDTGAVALATWIPFARAGQLEYEACMGVQALAGKLVTADLRPVQIAVERVGGGRGVQSMLAVANAAGVVAGILAARFDTAGLWRPTPAEWKRACDLSGIANKAAVKDKAGEIIRGGRAYVTVRGLEDMRQDVADAVCIAWADRQQGIHAVTDGG